MRTGVVLELREGRAVVLDGSGGFREVAALQGWRPGDVVPLPGGRKRAGRLRLSRLWFSCAPQGKRVQ